MAETIITNYSEFDGTYDELPMNVTSNIVTTKIVSGITATKAADKELWASGQLTYTITLENDTEVDFVNLIFTDKLISALVLDETSVTVNGTPTTDFTYTDNELTINLETIEAGGTTIITFRVDKA